MSIYKHFVLAIFLLHANFTSLSILIKVMQKKVTIKTWEKLPLTSMWMHSTLAMTRMTTINIMPATTKRRFLSNFHGIEFICSNCHYYFPFKLLFHKHLKTTYLPDNLRYYQVPISLLISLLVRESKATLDSIGLGFVFGDWSYTTTLVTLSSYAMLLLLDLATFYCLDTGCGITLVDKKWLYKYTPNKMILKIAVPLKMHNIRAFKHKFKEFVLMFIYFLRANKYK